MNEMKVTAMTESAPRVSVGLPVFNGERYVAEAVESILSQTFHDFELIISDNASTDATEQMCREYAAKDPRVHYHRSEVNQGAAWNHNRAVELARGEYFKWQCHDDYCDATFLEKCLAVVESDPGVILCYPQFVRVDEQGKRLGTKSSRVNGLAAPHERFRSLIYRRDSCEEIYGITRTDVIRKTALIGPYSNSDDTFLAELALHGRFHEVPEPLFFYRIHQAQSTSAYPTRSGRMAWFDPAAGGRISFPFLKLYAAYFSLISHSSLPWRERVRCQVCLVGWFWSFRNWLLEDLRAARSVVFRGRLAPWFKKYAPWTRPVWHWMKGMQDRWHQSEFATARAKRRVQREQWELKAEK
jgi:glycosyltransferase involved in cell wall biosynthesis